MSTIHHYAINIEWTGNKGEDTASYSAYDRNFILRGNGKPSIECSTDPAFRGDSSKYNPEDMLLAALSSCHMLWYLHLCADEGIQVVSYSDDPTGEMADSVGLEGGRFLQVTLNPKIVIRQKDKIDKALQLHDIAKAKCFIANSCNFPIGHLPTILTLA